MVRCHPCNEAVSSTDGTRRVAWLTVNMDPAYVVQVTDALSGGPMTRAHDGTNLITV